MKKAILIIVFLMSLQGGYSQKSSININFGHRLKFEHMSKWGFGAEYQRQIFDKVRVAPSATVYVGNDAIGLDIQANIEYLFPVDERVTLYPLAGFTMSNNHENGITGGSGNSTRWGINLGAGAECSVLKTNYVNLQFTYSSLFKKENRESENYTVIRIGYGFRF